MLPGDPSGVRAAAGLLVRSASASRGAGGDLLRLRECAWEGAAADAFRAKVRTASDEADAVAGAFERGSRVLQAYADVLQSQMQAADAAEEVWSNARERALLTPLDLVALLDVRRAVDARHAAVSTAQRAAIDAAAQLDGILGPVGWGEHWWDPFGWGDSDDVTVPDRGVDGSILNDGSWDPGSVHQGKLGDCYLMASIMGLLNSDDGDQWVKDNIRWDAAREGYWVTLYPFEKPVEYFVDRVYDQGATEPGDGLLFWSSSKPSIAALYEAAAAQELGYRELASGGTSAEALALLTGKHATSYERVYGDGYAGSLPEIRAALDSGASVVASSDRYSTSLSGQSHLIEAETVAADGGTEVVDLRIATMHTYMVDRVDADGGVWLRNPWGEGNSYDDGVEFKVAADDFADIFYDVSASGAR
ncbi:C2 family cysteine protease [Cellulomonas soli]|uniref:C2 family cysteine protease n=1 Tax=Cellulomonas soli TaxID=931535 RepID=UPI0015CD7E47|nr:C2 family cysteine protease [Cellulomonas soli]